MNAPGLFETNILSYLLNIAREQYPEAAYTPPLAETRHKTHFLVTRTTAAKFPRNVLVKYIKMGPERKIVLEELFMTRHLSTAIFDWAPIWCCVDVGYYYICVVCGMHHGSCAEKRAKSRGKLTKGQTHQIAAYLAMLQFLPRELALIIGEMMVA